METYEAEDVYRADMIRCFIVSDVLIYVGYYDTHPPNEGWEGYLDVARSLMPKLHGLLLITRGSTLTPKQRARVRAVFGGSSVWTAVLTDSLVTRGTLTALSWFGIPIAGFPSRACGQALRWMKREEICETVERDLRELAKDVRPGVSVGERA